ncbi:hypothetical protein [Nostoc punctiforme]|uniref:Uncharacterized protein n=2 Tax=Nostoc punctiforme TaxID=272131 RepID=B2ITE6_NOSP7|nr:hypothetical protein [Nostoc punctiforme]ACC81177.1 hypothetical protein Npun_R2623 [Nostoc punctiforme PCC 73102]RCJ41120.1 hypothetical protein A6769_38870 [Nostoc punctiforme NIES-2108]
MREKLSNLIPTALGGLGLTVTTIGAGILILGLSGKVVTRLADALKPHELTIEKMVVYGGNAGIIGLCTISVAAISQAVSDKLAEAKVEQMIAELETKHHCNGCIYYSANNYLPCAVHPELPQYCSDFTI